MADSEANLSSQTPETNAGHSAEAERHYQLAVCYATGDEGYEEDWPKAIKEFLAAAELGHAKAMLEVAADYFSTDNSVLGTDVEKAEFWARKAIALGNDECHDLLFRILFRQRRGAEAISQLEIGVAKGVSYCIESYCIFAYYGISISGLQIKADNDRLFNLLKSVEWDDNHDLAFQCLGNLYKDRGDIANAIKYQERALTANPENYSAMKFLGGLLLSDGYQDFPRAKSLFECAAEHGSEDAMLLLGSMLYFGEGCEKDLPAAIEWCKKAAKKGVDEAIDLLYQMMAYDNPTELVKIYEELLASDPENYTIMAYLGHILHREKIKDYSRARPLLECAAEHGVAEAMNEIGCMLFFGEGCEKDMPAAIEWFKKAAQEGLTSAMVNLYWVLENDNLDEAMHWLTLAAEKGDVDAQEILTELGVGSE